jgi:tRNA (guanine37-N1)-methyltransferase
MNDESHSGVSEDSFAGVPFQVDVFTLFPGMFRGPLDESILRRAQERDLIRIRLHDIRDWTPDRHRTADDTPYGGGAGMVMSAPPIVAAVEETLGPELGRVPIVLLSAGGRRFNQEIARSLAGEHRLVLICGRYEGIDERVADVLGAEQFSIGDFVLTGGELPALVVIDAVCRLRPGVIDAASIVEESHSAPFVEYPHYTRPVDFRGRRVPDVLLQGHHAQTAAWRRTAALARTARWRPDMLVRAAHIPRAKPERADETSETSQGV